MTIPVPASLKNFLLSKSLLQTLFFGSLSMHAKSIAILDFLSVRKHNCLRMSDRRRRQEIRFHTRNGST